MKNTGYILVEQVLREFKDEGGTERSRFKRFTNNFIITFKSEFRKFCKLYKVWLYPTYLWSDMVNVLKMMYRMGTGLNQEMQDDFNKLFYQSSLGKFKTGKEYNNAIQDIMKKHNLRKQRLFDHKEH